MPIICPTVTAYDTHQFREQIERVAPFAKRVHLDFMDGHFAKPRSIELIQAWWPPNLTADLHIMYDSPLDDIETVISLKPDLVIVHAEAKGDFVDFAKQLHSVGIKAGVALLKPTPPPIVKKGLEFIDHVLVFSGDLGKFGGRADLGLLDKTRALKALKPSLEIGWDGGINDQNAQSLSQGGVDVLNVGGFIQQAANPKKAFASLTKLVK